MLVTWSKRWCPFTLLWWWANSIVIECFVNSNRIRIYNLIKSNLFGNQHWISSLLNFLTKSLIDWTPKKKSSISSRNLWKIGQKATQLNMNCQIFTYFICLFRKNKSFIDHNRAVLTPNNLIKWQIILKRKATDSWMLNLVDYTRERHCTTRHLILVAIRRHQ